MIFKVCCRSWKKKEQRRKKTDGHLNENTKEQSHSRGKVLIESHSEEQGVQVNMDPCTNSLAGQMLGLCGGKGCR